MELKYLVLWFLLIIFLIYLCVNIIILHHNTTVYIKQKIKSKKNRLDEYIIMKKPKCIDNDYKIYELTNGKFTTCIEYYNHMKLNGIKTCNHRIKTKLFNSNYPLNKSTSTPKSKDKEQNTISINNIKNDIYVTDKINNICCQTCKN